MKFLKKLSKVLKSQAIALLALMTSVNVFANQLMIDDAYIRATIPGTTVSSGYMKLMNHSDVTHTLIGAKSDVSARVEIHEHIMNDGMMKMQQVESLSISPHQSLRFEPGGYHLMIFDLEKPLMPGQRIDIIFTFADNTQQAVNFVVESIKTKKQSKSSHHHHH